MIKKCRHGWLCGCRDLVLSGTILCLLASLAHQPQLFGWAHMTSICVCMLCRNDAQGCSVEQVEANDQKFFRALEAEVKAVNR